MTGEVWVVFDLDDTLYLERDYVASGFAAVGRVAADHHGISGLESAASAAFAAGARGDVFDRALGALGHQNPAGLVPELVRVYRTHRPDIRLLPDAAAALRRYAGTGLSVVTDGPVDSQSAKVEVLGLRDAAHPIVLTGALGPGMAKPHPRAFLDVARVADGRRLAYVADNPAKDFVAPAELGWRTVRIRRPGGLHSAVASGQDVDAEIGTLDDLADALGAGR